MGPLKMGDSYLHHEVFMTKFLWNKDQCCHDVEEILIKETANNTCSDSP